MRTLLGGCLLTISLGSIHAFSVFIQPLEQALTANRSQISAIYSLALVSLTIAVWGGHHIYRRFTPATLAAITCTIAALGLAITGTSETLATHLLGYSLLFGGANGIGYGLSLYVISNAMPERTGFGMGTVTAVYALGATLFVQVFERLITSLGVPATLFTMAGVMLFVAAIAGWLYAGLGQADSKLDVDPKSPVQGAQNQMGQARGLKLLLQLWLGYGLGVVAGLMAIGHAAGIVDVAGASDRQIVMGVMLIGLGNALGGFTAGWLVDRVSPRLILLVLALMTGIVLIILALQSDIYLVLSGLTLVGFTYGAIIAIYPVVTVAYYGPEAAPKAYGQIFTAWGMAGFLGPWLAGYLYDLSGGYDIAMGLASLAALLAAGVVFVLPKS